MVANYIKNELEGTHLQIKDIVEENGRFDPSEHMEIITEIMGRMLGVNLVTITTDLYDTRNVFYLNIPLIERILYYHFLLSYTN